MASPVLSDPGNGTAPAARGPKIGRPLQQHPLGLVRGVVAEQVVVSTLLDPYMSLRALAGYSGLSVRTLRNHLYDTRHPLPHYRVGVGTDGGPGKLLVRRSEFDAWVGQYRRVGDVETQRVVAELMQAFK